MSSTPQPPGDEGLWGSLRRLGRTLLVMMQTRLELLSTEIAEERFHLVRTLLVVLGALFCLQAGVMLAVLFIVLVVSPDHRLATIGIAALVLLLGALGSAWWLLSWLKKRPPLFAATIAELRKDRERLGGGT